MTIQIIETEPTDIEVIPLIEELSAAAVADKMVSVSSLSASALSAAAADTTEATEMNPNYACPYLCQITMRRVLILIHESYTHELPSLRNDFPA